MKELVAMTGILVTLLVIITAAFCFLIGMLYGVALKNAWDWKDKNK